MTTTGGCRTTLTRGLTKGRPASNPTKRNETKRGAVALVAGILLPLASGFLPKNLPSSTTITRAASTSTAAATPNTDTSLIDMAETFINTQTGFYSPAAPDMFAEDFVFRGPVIGPLNKVDYLKTMDTFKVFRAFPDISPNAFGFSADPVDEGRVWFFCRNTGTNDGPWGLGYGLEAPPSGDTVSGVPEAFSVTFDADRKVRLLTVGYVADRFYPNSNTDGVGAAFGLLKVAGIPLPGGLAYRAAVALANRLPGAGAKSCSKREDVPQWWLDRSEERGMDGYNI